MGFSEIIFILFMVLVLFGADKLPEIARTLGKTIRQVRDATDEIRSEIQRGVEKTGIDTSFLEETQKEIEKMKEEIEQTNLFKK
jgi:sec-independent translocation protein mttA/hcf106